MFVLEGVHAMRGVDLTKLAVAALLSVTLLTLLAACGDGSEDGDKGGEATGTVVELSHNFFDPSELTIDSAATVVFRNIVAMSHPLLSEEAGMNTGAFPKGDRSFTFDRPGTFTITNTAHGTTMTIVVR